MLTEEKDNRFSRGSLDIEGEPQPRRNKQHSTDTRIIDSSTDHTYFGSDGSSTHKNSKDKGKEGALRCLRKTMLRVVAKSKGTLGSYLVVFFLSYIFFILTSWWQLNTDSDGTMKTFIPGSSTRYSTLSSVEHNIDTTFTIGNRRISLAEEIQNKIKADVSKEIYNKVEQMNVQAQGTKVYPPTEVLPENSRMRILVTGGAGFVGSHLVDRLMEQGHEVIVLDNMFTGRKKNVVHWVGHPNFMLLIHDVVEPIMLEVDQIYHLACPASPPHYQYNPIKTIKTSTEGTLNMLGLAKRTDARILLTSTSEVYGDPQVHPQSESYWGNVNPIGPRACYDEGKRVAETMMYAYKAQSNLDVRVARIFNTFGPRMHPNDGRVVSNFIIQALQGKDITIYGDGKQTRSFQYVSDLVSGLIALMNHDYDLPCNLGNPDEYTVEDFAVLIKGFVQSNSTIKFLSATRDDPTKRKPDITVANRELGWEPVVDVKDGLSETIKYFRKELEDTGEITPTGPNAARPKGEKPERRKKKF